MLPRGESKSLVWRISVTTIWQFDSITRFRKSKGTHNCKPFKITNLSMVFEFMRAPSLMLAATTGSSLLSLKIVSLSAFWRSKNRAPSIFSLKHLSLGGCLWNYYLSQNRKLIVRGRFYYLNYIRNTLPNIWTRLSLNKWAQYMKFN